LYTTSNDVNRLNTNTRDIRLAIVLFRLGTQVARFSVPIHVGPASGERHGPQDAFRLQSGEGQHQRWEGLETDERGIRSSATRGIPVMVDECFSTLFAYISTSVPVSLSTLIGG
jgi:hypothetical protein